MLVVRRHVNFLLILAPKLPLSLLPSSRLGAHSPKLCFAKRSFGGGIPKQSLGTSGAWRRAKPSIKRPDFRRTLVDPRKRLVSMATTFSGQQVRSIFDFNSATHGLIQSVGQSGMRFDANAWNLCFHNGFSQVSLWNSLLARRCCWS